VLPEFKDIKFEDALKKLKLITLGEKKKLGWSHHPVQYV